MRKASRHIPQYTGSDQPREDAQAISITLTAEVFHALEAVTTPSNRSAFVERAITKKSPPAIVAS
jgi:hypothetical protein